MLIDLHKSKRTLRWVTNGGKLDHNMMGHLLGFFDVWFNTKSRLDIISWVDVRKNQDNIGHGGKQLHKSKYLRK